MPAWTPEQAREMGRKGGLTKAARERERKSQDPKVRHKEHILENLDDLTEHLVDAALRRGIFADRVIEENEKGEKYEHPIYVQGISSELQMKALFRALDETIGRPTTQKPESDVPPRGEDEDEPEEGLGFTHAEEDDTPEPPAIEVRS